MSKSKNNNVMGTTERPRPTSVNFTLTQARNMLPLVTRIVTDVRDAWQNLTRMETEQADLDRRRRKLEWPERARRYQIGEEIAGEHRRLQEATAELEQIHLILVDPVNGEVAFPTHLSARPAYFLWKLGDTDFGWWCFAQEPGRHPIPASGRR